MKLTVVQKSITEIEADAIIVNLFQGVTKPGGATGAVDRATGGLISRLIEAGECAGKRNECATLHFPPGLPCKKLIVVGLGQADEFDLDYVREVTASSLKAAAGEGVRRVATIVHGAGIGGLNPEDAARAVAEGAVLGTYRFEAFKSEPSKARIEELIVVEASAEKVPAIQKGVERGTLLAECTNFARDLVNTPSNHLTPAMLAEKAADMARQVGLECTIIERDEMERLGMGALLGVAKGSAEPPKLIVLRHRGGRGPLTALVGKGVCFDSGGISLKPAQGMADMKSDMAGAAAVLGAMRAIALLKAEADVMAVVPAVENMPSGTALKPGDILRTMTGKTIEIDNTDAEGRLILADAVAYAGSQGAERIVDVATLTGACVIALGRVYTGIVANDDELVQELFQAASKTGEKYTRLPTDPQYQKQYKSDVADIKNTGGREAGAITGGMIIGEFVGEAKWAHLDIAGTSFIDKPRPYLPKGGTGVGVRTLAEWLSA